MDPRVVSYEQGRIKSECTKSASADRPYFYVIGSHALPETEAFIRGMGYDVIINGGGSKTLNADVYAATLPPPAYVYARRTHTTIIAAQ